MSLCGILLDVSGSMRSNIGGGIDEDGEPWAQSIFNVIDDLIEHDLTSKNRVFVIGFGAKCAEKEIFDVIATLEQFHGLATTSQINQILDILEANGARNIRKWATVELIQDGLLDNMAEFILLNLQSDREFLRKFVYDILSPGCRDTIATNEYNDVEQNSDLLSTYTSYFGLNLLTIGEICITTSVSVFKQATKKDIEEIVEKTTKYFLKEYASYILKDVGPNSVISVQDASCIIRGYVGETQFAKLSKKRSQELLAKIEPFIYGGTPLYESLEKATKCFEENSAESKLLFVLSDGEPADGDPRDKDKIEHYTSRLEGAGVNVVSCYITRSLDVNEMRLYDQMHDEWELGAKFLFSLSSKLRTQDLPLGILINRQWTIDIDKNETNLFIQANHPDNLEEACTMAKNVVCYADTLSELLVSVDLDIYISGENTKYLKSEEQVGETCYAHASAVVLDLAMLRILGRQGGYPGFQKLKSEMIDKYTKHGAKTCIVLQEMCPMYRLHSKKVTIEEAKMAIFEKRPVVATFRLTSQEFKTLNQYFKQNRSGILTRKQLDVPKRPKSSSPETIGHAVVLTSYNSRCLVFMNSWGHKWGDNGFFRVEDAGVLGDRLEFFDISWELDDLTDEEIEYYDKHGAEVAAKLKESLKGLQHGKYTCQECEQTSLVTEFQGTLAIVRCPKCLRKFPTEDNRGNILALNVHLTSLSKK